VAALSVKQAQHIALSCAVLGGWTVKGVVMTTAWQVTHDGTDTDWHKHAQLICDKSAEAMQMRGTAFSANAAPIKGHPEARRGLQPDPRALHRETIQGGDLNLKRKTTKPLGCRTRQICLT